MINQQIHLPILDIEVAVEKYSVTCNRVFLEFQASEGTLKAIEALRQKTILALTELILNGRSEQLIQCSYTLPSADGYFYLSSVQGEKDCLTGGWKIRLTYNMRNSSVLNLLEEY